MDEDPSGALLLPHWRIVLGVFTFSALAFLLVTVFPWFTGWQGAVFALLGAFAGAASGNAPNPPAADRKSAPTPAGVACSAAALAGGLWGAASSVSAPSFLAGVIVVALLIWGCFGLAGAQATSQGRDRMILCSLSASLAYLLGAGITSLALHLTAAP